MYFVDRKKMEEQLKYIEKLFRYFSEVVRQPETEQETLAFERAIHMTIEAMLDVGNQMIDGFIMRDPGSYEDIIDILEDEQVIPQEEATLLLQFITLRKKLIVNYTHLQIEDVWQGFKQAEQALKKFPPRIRAYVLDHLGPVSAFIPDAQ